MLFRKLFVLLPMTLIGLDREPWFCNMWEFTFTPTYTYGRYPDVQNGVPHQQSPSHDHVLSFDFAVPPTPQWQIDAEVEFADTHRQAMGLRSMALQLKYLWLNDLLGDPVALTTGAVVRGVTRHSIKDVSCPYHSYLNFEVNVTVGKEWSYEFDWTFRTYGVVSWGMATHGYPWVSALGVAEAQVAQAHRWALFLEGALGLGPHRSVFIDHFKGYASIQHRNIDLFVQYTYAGEVWGRLSLAYGRRIYAHSFPEKMNFFILSYMLPFSLF